MRNPIILSVLMATAVSATAQADFVITAAPPAATQPFASEASPKTPGPANHPATTRFKMAYGFGDQVPLSFAVRQIVPATIKVIYGPGVNPQALVDWKGGQVWNHALLDALKPLGLRLVATGTAVEIRK